MSWTRYLSRICNHWVMQVHLCYCQLCIIVITIIGLCMQQCKLAQNTRNHVQISTSVQMNSQCSGVILLQISFPRIGSQLHWELPEDWKPTLLGAAPLPVNKIIAPDGSGRWSSSTLFICVWSMPDTFWLSFQRWLSVNIHLLRDPTFRQFWVFSDSNCIRQRLLKMAAMQI